MKERIGKLIKLHWGLVDIAYAWGVWKVLDFLLDNHNEIFEIVMKTVVDTINLI